MNKLQNVAGTGRQAAAGFSLMELMIVIAIVGILGAIAFPAYNNYVMRGKRAEGRNALLDLAAREERFYSDNNQYTSTLGSGGLNYTEPANCSMSGVQTETCKYSLAISGVTGSNQTFTITATPVQPDPECGDLTLDKTGTKGEGGTQDVRFCWGK